MRAVSVQVSIRTADHVLGGVLVAELCKANRDRGFGGTPRQCIGDLVKAFANPLDVGVRQRAYELIATEAHDQVIGAQALPQRLGDRDQKRVSGKMAHGVVDPLQAIDVDECDHQMLGSAMGTVHLALKLLHPGAAAPDVRELVGLRRFPVKRRLGAITRRQGAIVGGVGAFLGGSCAIVGGTRTIVRRALAIVRGPESALCAPRRSRRLDRFPARPRARRPCGGYLVARRCHLGALVCGDIPRHAGPQASMSLLVANLRRVLTMFAADVASLLIGSREGFPITGGLVLVRGRLF